MRAINKLDNFKIREFIKTGGAQVSDGNGLNLTLSKGGLAAWTLRYRFGGKGKELTLGRYPDISLADARKLSATARAQVQQGVDPGTQKQAKKAEAARHVVTVDLLFEEYSRVVIPTLRPQTIKGKLSYLKTDFLPCFGARAVDQVTFDDARIWLARIAETRSYYAASNARKAAMSVFQHAVRRRLIQSNPFEQAALRVVAARPVTKPRVVLDDRELALLLGHLTQMGEFDAIALQLQLITGCRISEVLEASWDEFDLGSGNWRIPKERCKSSATMRRSHHEIRLPELAIRLLQKLKSAGGDSLMLFPPMARRDRHSMSVSAYQTRLHKYVDALNERAKAAGVAGGCRSITTHDLRAIARTNFSKLGASEAMARRALNQKLLSLDEIYSHNYFDDEREALLQRWAERIEELRAAGGRLAL
jgi:integrase